MALTNKLSAIGDAIREKTGKTELLTLDAMPLEIASITTGGGGDIEIEPIVLSSGCQYDCAGPLAGKYIELFGDSITTRNINNASNMFYESTVETIPFDINMDAGATTLSTNNMFAWCEKLKNLPKITPFKMNNFGSMFYGCKSLRVIPNDYFDEIDFSNAKNATSAYQYACGSLFYNCHSLRSVPLDWLKNMNPVISATSSHFYNTFYYCDNLDEINAIPVPYIQATWTSNAFHNTFNHCNRLKRLTFKLDENNQPIVVKWKSQTITLDTGLGFFVNNTYYVVDYNSGITKDKEVKDDVTYQALKNDPDWYTNNINYSRYNHNSAVETINTLPDTSAYLATAGGTNTIKFMGAAGALTDGGAINTLTAEEIAVATAKGWTVSFT